MTRTVRDQAAPMILAWQCRLTFGLEGAVVLGVVMAGVTEAGNGVTVSPTAFKSKQVAPYALLQLWHPLRQFWPRARDGGEN